MPESFLCDVCRANLTTYHICESQVGGEIIERHLCDSCHAKSAKPDELERLALLRHGKCQYCGEQAQSMSWGPGLALTPRQQIMCFSCSEHYHHLVKAELDSLPADLSREDQLNALRDVEKRIEIYMTARHRGDSTTEE